MANEYGKMRRFLTGAGIEVLKGTLNIPQSVGGDIALIPIPMRGENSPSHDVKIKSNGDWATLGKAWTKELKDGSGDFFTLTLDSPSMQRPVNLSIFALDDEEQPKEWERGETPVNYKIIWQRPRRTVTASQSSGGTVGEDLDDDIPF